MLIIIFVFARLLYLSLLFYLIGFLTIVNLPVNPMLDRINHIQNKSIANSILSINALFWLGIFRIPLFGILTRRFKNFKGYKEIGSYGLIVGMGFILIGFTLSVILAILIKDPVQIKKV